jgi:hypothetical protein
MYRAPQAIAIDMLKASSISRQKRITSFDYLPYFNLFGQMPRGCHEEKQDPTDPVLHGWGWKS